MLKRVSSLTISDAITQYQDGYLAARNLAPLTPLLYGRQRGKARATMMNHVNSFMVPVEV